MRSGYEGLEVSRRPCARVLSVAGLLDALGPFPGRERFILRREKPPFCPPDPLSFNTLRRTANTHTARVYCYGYSRVPDGMYRQGVPTRRCTGRHIQGGGYHQGTQGGIYTGYTLLRAQGGLFSPLFPVSLLVDSSCSGQ